MNKKHVEVLKVQQTRLRSDITDEEHQLKEWMAKREAIMAKEQEDAKKDAKKGGKKSKE